MSEWKELEIDNLPSDILTGDYKIESYMSLIWKDRGGDICYRLGELKNGIKYRYRKRQPKAPSHEEIMTKWWRFDTSEKWEKVNSFRIDSKGGLYSFPCFQNGCFLRKFDFIDIPSADIPPEA